METMAVEVKPGSDATCTIRIRNTGVVVDQFVLDVVGIIGGWASVVPAVLNILPGDEAVANVTFAPPRSSSVLAGDTAFAVRVMSREDVAGSVVQEGVVTVLPFAEIVAEIVPRTSRTRRKGEHELAIDNNGNQPLRVAVLAADPDNALSFRCVPTDPVTEPGTATFVKITARPVKRRWRGPDERLPFQVVASPETGTPVTVEAAVLQRAVIPKGLLLAAGVLAVAVVALAVLWQAVLKPSIKSTASDTAVAAVNSQSHNLAASASKAQSQASQAQSQANQAQSAAQNASSAVAKAAASASSVAAAGGLPGGGTPTDFRLAATAAPNQSSTFTTYAYQPPAKQSVAVSDIILQNPAADQGMLQIRRNKEVLIEVSLASFRDLDYHFVVPLAFSNKDQVILAVDCTNPATVTCTPAAYFSGQLRK
ncbi:MAG: COG1470 family protein [Jatrophihabitans sp.]